MKKLIALTLALCLVLCGCGGGDSEETTAVPTETTEVTVEPTEEYIPVTEAPVEEGIPENVNPLTGEELEEESNARPFAVMINNHKEALPHCGVSQADVVYETRVEGGMTRFMAIFSDLSEVEAIGSVRSCRPPFVELADAYDAIYVSASGSSNVLSQITDEEVTYINALTDSKYFYRNQARLNAGVAYEHTLFISGQGLQSLAEDRSLRTARAVDQTYGFQFNDSVSYDGETANTIEISFYSGGKTTTANYDAEAGAYTLYQQGQDYIDGNTGELVEFRNVLILEGSTYINENGVHVHMETVGEGPGYYARDGKIIPIQWSRADLDSPYVYTTADGETLNFGVGTTYIAIITDGSPVSYQ